MLSEHDTSEASYVVAANVNNIAYAYSCSDRSFSDAMSDHQLDAFKARGQKLGVSKFKRKAMDDELEEIKRYRAQFAP